MSEISQPLQACSQTSCKSIKPESPSVQDLIPAPFIKALFEEKLFQHAALIWNTDATIQNQCSLEEFIDKTFVKLKEQDSLDEKVQQVREKITLTRKDLLESLRVQKAKQELFQSEIEQKYTQVQNALAETFSSCMGSVLEKVKKQLSAFVQPIKLDNFTEKVLQSSVPVVVEFYADWCGPCRRMAKVLDEVAAEVVGKVKVFKVNVDQEKELVKRCNIVIKPTFLFFKDGKVEMRLIGSQTKQSMLNDIDKMVVTVQP